MHEAANAGGGCRGRHVPGALDIGGGVAGAAPGGDCTGAMNDGVRPVDEPRQGLAIGEGTRHDLLSIAGHDLRRVAGQETQRLPRGGQRGNEMAPDKACSTGDRNCGHSGSRLEGKAC